jgi:hypothetical protein
MTLQSQSARLPFSQPTRRFPDYGQRKEAVMKPICLIAAAASIGVLAGACTTDGYGPYYGYSQGYAYPGYGYSPGYGYPPGYGYYTRRPYYPARYGYAPYPSYPYAGGGPGITFTAHFPQGTVP